MAGSGARATANTRSHVSTKKAAAPAPAKAAPKAKAKATKTKAKASPVKAKVAKARVKPVVDEEPIEALEGAEVDAELEAETPKKPRSKKGGDTALVIVESPAKATTIKKYLGAGYVVKASVGHVKDLPKKTMGIDIEHDFQPRYEVIDGKKKVL